MIGLFTAYGRKNIEAITGMLLLAFLVEHFFANLLLLLNDSSVYLWYVDTLSRNLFIRVLEVGLLLLFVFHIAIGLLMRLRHQRMLKRVPRAKRTKDITTRFVGWTGAVILIFLVVHIASFFVPNRIATPPEENLYQQAHAAFTSVWYTAFYIVSMAALGMHLKHGIKSALFSFKFLPNKHVPRLRTVLSWLGFGTSIGLAYIALHLFLSSQL